ncbi:MAG: flippase [Clostridia bacterium]|nr:flippase [Clostridia bacterium]
MTFNTDTGVFGAKRGLSIKQNYIYSLLYKIIAVIVPVLITPYLARVLEPDGNGVISYVSSIASYFIILANVGIEGYGQRTVAIHRDDDSFLRKFVIEIFLLKIFLTVISAAAFLIIFTVILGAHRELYLVFSLSVAFVMFDFSWLFQGLENFRILAITHTLSRVVYVVLVFVLVKTKGDLTVAALLWVGMTVANYFLSFPFVLKFFKGAKINGLNPFMHLKESVIYFVPIVAIQIYAIFDKTMIGIITRSDFENGYYEEADKIVKLLLTAVTTLNIIMRSRVSYCYARQQFDEIKNHIKRTANIAYALSFPMAIGLIAVAKPFVDLYLGAGYEKCVTLLYVLAPIIPIIATSNLLGSHYYTPFNKQRTSNKFLITGAAVNFCANILLITFWQSVGAAVGSVIAESVVAVLYVVNANGFFKFRKLVLIAWKYIYAAAAMFIVVFPLTEILPTNIPCLFAEVAAGVISYAIMLWVLQAEFFTDAMKKVFKRIFRRR